MKLSITGATGDIGGSYLDSVGRKSAVKILAREGSYISQVGVQPFFFSALSYEAAMLEEFVQGDVLVHCAALLNSDEYNLIETVAANAMLTSALIASAKTDLPKVIYISTEMVYGLEVTPELHLLCSNFLCFYKKHFSDNRNDYDLRRLAEVFINENQSFPFNEYNNYSLAKYLGEVIVNISPDAAILRVSNAYGPGYSNPRLIPRMIRGRLTGHDVVCPNEQRDFVFFDDINRLINTVILQNLTGAIDCRSGEKIETSDLAEMITRATPTAYGELSMQPARQKHRPEKSIPVATATLASIIDPTSFAEGFSATLRWHKEQTYHQMKDSRSLQDFLKPDEQVVKMLKGSSAAHLCVVFGSDRVHKVRKIAVYDGVEGNGIAKVASEIKYYQHIAEHRPKLASMYPDLLDAKTDETFSSETIEYLPGKNFYQAIKDADLPVRTYEESLKKFIDKFSRYSLEDCQPATDPYGDLDAYYVERSFSRLHPIGKILTIQDKLKINGKQHIAPHIILGDLLHNKRLREVIKPRTEAFCSHGDLTLLNTVFIDETHDIRLIDPRGYIGNWDPLYDYAKIQFTLGGFGEFIVGEKLMVAREGNGNFTVRFDQIPRNSLLLHDNFLHLLASDSTFTKKVIPYEPHWPERVAFAKATHFLADIPFRLFTDGTTDTALASYVIGTYYLNEVYEALQK